MNKTFRMMYLEGWRKNLLLFLWALKLSFENSRKLNLIRKNENGFYIEIKEEKEVLTSLISLSMKPYK
jgi:hypothetical protein